jgi:hypothetical protein
MNSKWWTVDLLAGPLSSRTPGRMTVVLSGRHAMTPHKAEFFHAAHATSRRADLKQSWFRRHFQASRGTFTCDRF